VLTVLFVLLTSGRASVTIPKPDDAPTSASQKETS
jgi:hypothetical protein